MPPAFHRSNLAKIGSAYTLRPGSAHCDFSAPRTSHHVLAPFSYPSRSFLFWQTPREREGGREKERYVWAFRALSSLFLAHVIVLTSS
ncbi:unnamed protein product [Caenorhabditis auriculariae]|uniref:Uncharacterized protein n=1 Tax=Caenorhabditis auriculariae TaxID=2777116 RepID=A0A8S1HMJ8_9PELO|nr:unnamed protein product [Caenorhabditis auriculariae]